MVRMMAGGAWTEGGRARTRKCIRRTRAGARARSSGTLSSGSSVESEVSSRRVGRDRSGGGREARASAAGVEHVGGADVGRCRAAKTLEVHFARVPAKEKGSGGRDSGGCDSGGCDSPTRRPRNRRGWKRGADAKSIASPVRRTPRVRSEDRGRSGREWAAVGGESGSRQPRIEGCERTRSPGRTRAQCCVGEHGVQHAGTLAEGLEGLEDRPVDGVVRLGRRSHGRRGGRGRTAARGPTTGATPSAVAAEMLEGGLELRFESRLVRHQRGLRRRDDVVRVPALRLRTAATVLALPGLTSGLGARVPASLARGARLLRLVCAARVVMARRMAPTVPTRVTPVPRRPRP